MARPEHAALDRERLQELREELGEDALDDIIERFCTQAQIRLDELSTAVSERDCESIDRLAHSLRGSSLNIGARTMSELCSELELEAFSPDAERMGEGLRQLEDAFETTQMALNP